MYSRMSIFAEIIHSKCFSIDIIEDKGKEDDA
jgi:hypothetical protein